jgi:hypothetical protein
VRSTGKGISRSYTRLFAEFLDLISLVHLGLLAPPTCVGFRYGLSNIISREVFLGRLCDRISSPRTGKICTTHEGSPPRRDVLRICQENPSYVVNVNPLTRSVFFPPSLH